MITSDVEYKRSKKELAAFEERIMQQEAVCEEQGLGSEAIQRLLAPSTAHFDQARAEVESYERLAEGSKQELARLQEFESPGRMLIALRIFRGLSQRHLAVLLDVDPSQVSRDERNEYHGVSFERIQRVMRALGFTMRYNLQEVRT